jgi:hypothetical protein
LLSINNILAKDSAAGGHVSEADISELQEFLQEIPVLKSRF